LRRCRLYRKPGRRLRRCRDRSAPERITPWPFRRGYPSLRCSVPLTAVLLRSADSDTAESAGTATIQKYQFRHRLWPVALRSGGNPDIAAPTVVSAPAWRVPPRAGAAPVAVFASVAAGALRAGENPAPAVPAAAPAVVRAPAAWDRPAAACRLRRVPDNCRGPSPAAWARRQRWTAWYLLTEQCRWHRQW